MALIYPIRKRQEMSTDIDIFVDPKCSLEEFKSILEKTFRINFSKEEEESSYVYYSMGIILKLYGDHGFEDDLGIQFSRYPYGLSIDIDTRARDYECRINLQYFMSSYIFSVLSKELALDSILVEDVQKILAESPSTDINIANDIIEKLVT
jgi:hypothetical protein